MRKSIFLTVSFALLSASCAQLGAAFKDGKKLDKTKVSSVISEGIGKMNRASLLKEVGQPYASTVRDGGKDQGKLKCDIWYMNGLSKTMIALKKSNGNIDEEPKLLTCFNEEDKLIYAEVDADIYKFKKTYVDPFKREYKATKGKSFKVAKKGITLEYTPDMTSPGLYVKVKNTTSKVVSINWAESNIIDAQGSNLEVAPATYSRSNWDRPAPKSKIMPGDEMEVFVYAKKLYAMNWSTKVLTRNPLCGNVAGFAQGASRMVEVINDENCVGKSSGMVLSYNDGSDKNLYFKFKMTKRQKVEKK